MISYLVIQTMPDVIVTIFRFGFYDRVYVSANIAILYLLSKVAKGRLIPGDFIFLAGLNDAKAKVNLNSFICTLSSSMISFQNCSFESTNLKTLCISIRHAKHNVLLRVNESRSNLRVSLQINMILPIIVIRKKGHDIDYCIKWDNLSSRSEKNDKKRRYFDDIFEMVVKSLETTGIYWNLRNFWSNKILFFSKMVVCTKYYYSQFWSRLIKLKG